MFRSHTDQRLLQSDCRLGDTGGELAKVTEQTGGKNSFKVSIEFVDAGLKVVSAVGIEPTTY
jgi:hypothetical protein